MGGEVELPAKINTYYRAVAGDELGHPGWSSTRIRACSRARRTPSHSGSSTAQERRCQAPAHGRLSDPASCAGSSLGEAADLQAGRPRKVGLHGVAGQEQRGLLRERRRHVEDVHGATRVSLAQPPAQRVCLRKGPLQVNSFVPHARRAPLRYLQRPPRGFPVRIAPHQPNVVARFESLESLFKPPRVGGLFPGSPTGTALCR